MAAGRPRARTWRSRGPRGATRAGRSSTDATRATRGVEPEPGEVAARESRGCATGRCRAICTGRSSTRRCGRGRCRSTSGSAASPSGSAFVALAADLAGDERSAARRAQGRARRGAAGAGAADHRPRPPGALPEHAAHLQAALADEPGRVVPGRVQRPSAPAPSAADLLGRAPRRRARLGARQRARSAATSAPTPACCWRPPPCRCGRAAASSSARSSSRPRRPPAPPPRGSRWRPPGLPADHPTRSRARPPRDRRDLAELTLSTVNERRLGRVGDALSQGPAGPAVRDREGARRARPRAGLLGAPLGPLASTRPASCTSPAGSPSASRGSRRARRRPATTRPSRRRRAGSIPAPYVGRAPSSSLPHDPGRPGLEHRCRPHEPRRGATAAASLTRQGRKPPAPPSGGRTATITRGTQWATGTRRETQRLETKRGQMGPSFVVREGARR